MNDSKPWYASVTIWASLIGALSPLAASVFHTNISDAQVQTIATDVAMTCGGVAGLVAIWGRLRATHLIGSSQPAIEGK